VNDFILKIKVISHSLAVIGEPINDKDLLMSILHGLGEDYDTVSLIIYKMDDINLEKVQYLLLMHEQSLATKNVVNMLLANAFDIVVVNVNFASHVNRVSNGTTSPGGFLGRNGGNF